MLERLRFSSGSLSLADTLIMTVASSSVEMVSLFATGKLFEIKVIVKFLFPPFE